MSLLSKLQKTDHYILSALILYSLYIYFSRDLLYSAYRGAESFTMFHYFILIIIPIIFLFISVKLIKKKNIKDGFKINTGLWVGLGIILIVAIANLSQRDQVYLGIHTTNMLIFILNILISEIIFRVMLISLIIKLLENTKTGIVIGIVVSAVVFSLLLVPFSDLTIYILLASGASALFYYGANNLLFILFWDSFILLSKSSYNDELLICLVSVLVYIVVSLFFKLSFVELTAEEIPPDAVSDKT